jgi:hypothetical protein
VPLPPLSQFHVAINQLLEIGTTECIDYDVRMHPSTAKKLHDFGSESQWQAEAATSGEKKCIYSFLIEYVS